MFGRIAGWYDLCNRVLSLGIDRYWRRVLADNVRLGPTGRVLDLAAGTLDVSLAIRRRYPDARIPALDFCLPMLQRGARKLHGWDAAAILPVAADAKKLPPARCVRGLRDHCFRHPQHHPARRGLPGDAARADARRTRLHSGIWFR